MKFNLLDTILDQASERIVAIKHVSLAEEYLADHFPTFPVLPGVMMVETMVQAARRMLADRGDWQVVVDQGDRLGLYRTYAEVEIGEPLALVVRTGSAPSRRHAGAHGHPLCVHRGRLRQPRDAH